MRDRAAETLIGTFHKNAKLRLETLKSKSFSHFTDKSNFINPVSALNKGG